MQEFDQVEVVDEGVGHLDEEVCELLRWRSCGRIFLSSGRRWTIAGASSGAVEGCGHQSRAPLEPARPVTISSASPECTPSANEQRDPCQGVVASPPARPSGTLRLVDLVLRPLAPAARVRMIPVASCRAAAPWPPRRRSGTALSSRLPSDPATARRRLARRIGPPRAAAGTRTRPRRRARSPPGRSPASDLGRTQVRDEDRPPGGVRVGAGTLAQVELELLDPGIDRAGRSHEDR